MDFSPMNHGFGVLSTWTLALLGCLYNRCRNVTQQGQKAIGREQKFQLGTRVGQSLNKVQTPKLIEKPQFDSAVMGGQGWFNQFFPTAHEGKGPPRTGR